MKILIQLFLFIALTLNCHAAISPYIRNVLTTNAYTLGTNLFLTNGILESIDTGTSLSLPVSVPNGGTGDDLSNGVGGAIPYYNPALGKFVTTPLIYTNGILFESTLGFLSVFHTNNTGELLLNLAEGGAAGPSIQSYSDRFVAANTNLSLEAVGPFNIRLRVDGSTVGEMIEFQNSGSNVVAISPLGKITVGPNTSAYGLNAGTLRHTVVASLDSPINPSITIQKKSDPTAFNEAYVTLNSQLAVSTNRPKASVTISSFASGVDTNYTGFWLLQSSRDTASAQYSTIEYSSGNTLRTRLTPNIPDATTPYVLGTDLTHNSGDLLAVQNNGTNRLQVSNLGAVTIGSVTKAQKTGLTPANGMLVYQTDNTPGFRAYVNGAWVLLSTAADP